MLVGKYPPFMIRRPPTAVIPEMALVIDIRGVCKAGATPQTEKYPVITDKEKMLVIVKMAGLVQAKPNPNTVNSPPASPKALLSDFLNKFSGT